MSAWAVHELPDCFQKTFDESLDGQAAFFREVYFYTNFPKFAPALLSTDHLTMYIEKCDPLIAYEGYYQGDPVRDHLDLWAVLVSLGQHGAQHGDVNLVNVVRHPTRGILLIDWEKATLRRGKSHDLFPGRIMDPVKHDFVCWDGPWGFCPGPVYGITALEMYQRHGDKV